MELITQSARFSFASDAGRTDAQGNYKVDSLWADSTYIVQATCNGYGQASSPQLHLEAGQPTTVRDLTLFKRDSSVAGVLLDANNKPVTGQRVYVNGPKTGYNNMTTDADGKFGCSVVSGDHISIFYNVGRGYNRQAARAGDTNIVLHTSPPRATPAAPVQHVAAPAQDSSAGPAAPAAPSIYDPADAVTWQGWVYAVGLLVVGGAIVVVINAVLGVKKKWAGA
jgi:hypothetical protein